MFVWEPFVPGPLAHGILAAAVFTSLFAACARPGGAPAAAEAEKAAQSLPAVALVKADGKPFRILQITDTHWDVGDGGTTQKTLDMMREAIETQKPDLLVLTGDNVWAAQNYVSAVYLVQFLDGFGIPYAMVLGNHDGEGAFDAHQIGVVYSAGKKSLFNPGPDSTGRTGNYAINITNPRGEILYSLIFLDSGNARFYGSPPPESYGGYGYQSNYDYILPEQIALYETFIRQTAREAKHLVPSLLFYHIPLPQIFDVRAEMTRKDPAAAAAAFEEEPCPPPVDSGLFDKVKELRSTKYMFFGHDHNNTLDYEYQGVHFVYGLKTGPACYYKPYKQGATLITINNDNTVTVEFKYQAAE